MLSADHGQPEAPGHLNELGILDAHYFDTGNLDKAPAIAALKRRFGLGEELIEAFFQPYVYLNRDLIEEKGLDQAEVEQAVTAELVRFDGVAAAISSSALRAGNLADNAVTRAIRKNFHAERSGDIYLVFEPNVFINDFDGLTVASTHGSPWRYDTHVPVIFAGAGLEPRRVSRSVTPYDIAPTLSAFLGIREPAAAVGVPLTEVLGY